MENPENRSFSYQRASLEERDEYVADLIEMLRSLMTQSLNLHPQAYDDQLSTQLNYPDTLNYDLRSIGDIVAQRNELTTGEALDKKQDLTDQFLYSYGEDLSRPLRQLLDMVVPTEGYLATEQKPDVD